MGCQPALQGSDKELSDYSLAELAERHLGGTPGGAASPGSGPSAASNPSSGGTGSRDAPALGASPFVRMRRALDVSRQLGEVLAARLLGEGAGLPMETLEREMQVGPCPS